MVRGMGRLEEATPMLLTLNAGFGELIGAPDLALIKSLGFGAVRQDFRTVADGQLAGEIADAGLAVIAVLDPETWGEGFAGLVSTIHKAAGGQRVIYEVGNELDGKMAPDAYGHAFYAVEHWVRMIDPDAEVITAGIRDTGHDPLLWLHRVLSTGLVSHRSGVGFHTYRATPPGVPREGYTRREHEYDALRFTARGRRLYHTEIGWSTAPRKASGCAGWFGKRWSYSDEQVAEFLDYELRINRDQGAECFTIFQLNDSATNDNEGRFGIRDYAGQLKPSAHVVARYA